MTIIVYRVTHLPTGRSYVGISGRPLSRRWKEHVSYAMRAVRTGALQGAIVKHGTDQFGIVEIERCETQEMACEAERRHILNLDTRWPNGFNMSDGGERRGGHTWCEATKEKMRQTALGREIKSEQRAKVSAIIKAKWADPAYREMMRRARDTPELHALRVASGRKTGLKYGGQMLGKKHTPEARAKMSIAQTGRVAWNKGIPATPESIERLAAAHRGKPGHRRGAKMSPETKAKMSAITKDRWANGLVAFGRAA